ncbi:MAG: carboxylating nicotinate-nucleotide diphosphorylase [Pseudomonadota bacterium]
MACDRPNTPTPPAHALINEAVRAALAEDLGLTGDITTVATIPADATATAVFRSRAPGVICGLPISAATFAALSDAVTFSAQVHDGARVVAGDVIASVTGPARAILTGERVALNYLGRLSGVASLTRAYADAIAHMKAHVIDTRKTTPGLRAFEKYAVRCGGGMNHRFGLFDAVLIKDNHIAVAGGITAALSAARATAGHMVKIEIEVDRLDQIRAVLDGGADAILLDNMTPADLKTAVGMIDGRLITEASGGVNLETISEIAETGVDLISVGALTHSAIVLDIGLDIDIA